jgi:hypothetical protein
MILKELTKIIECYGTQSECWPEADRDAALDLIASDSDAKQMLSQYMQLNALLDQHQVPEFPNLESRILNQNLPARSKALLDKLLDWLLPATPAKLLWRPVVVACMPLLFGVLVGNFFNFGVNIEYVETAEYWEDELYLLSLNDYPESQF